MGPAFFFKTEMLKPRVSHQALSSTFFNAAIDTYIILSILS